MLDTAGLFMPFIRHFVLGDVVVTAAWEFDKTRPEHDATERLRSASSRSVITFLQPVFYGMCRVRPISRACNRCRSVDESAICR